MDKSDSNFSSTLIVPVDYSDCSVQACRYAAKIAQKSNSKILLFHTFYSPAFDLIELTGGILTQEQLRKSVTEKLLESETDEMLTFLVKIKEFPELKLLNNNSISYQLKTGIAKEEISRYTSEIKPFMVIIGTKESEKRNSSITGSIAETAIRKLKVPVLTIPQKYSFNNNENPQRILYLTDFDESDFLSIKKLLKFTDLFDMSIHCVHIGSQDEKWERLKMEGLKDYFHKAYQNDKVECCILDNKPDLLNAIDNYVSKNSINILSLTHRKRKLIEKILNPSIAKKVFYNSSVPLLVFHD